MIEDLNLKGKTIDLPNLVYIDNAATIYKLCNLGCNIRLPDIFKDNINLASLT